MTDNFIPIFNNIESKKEFDQRKFTSSFRDKFRDNDNFLTITKKLISKSINDINSNVFSDSLSQPQFLIQN